MNPILLAAAGLCPSTKFAATRYDREVAAGNIDYFDVADRVGVDVNDYDLDELKRTIRPGLRAPSEPTESSLGLKRRLSSAALAPTSERQLAARISTYQRNAAGQLPSQPASYLYDPTSYRAAFDGNLHVGGNAPSLLRSYSQGGLGAWRAAFAADTQDIARRAHGQLNSVNPQLANAFAQTWNRAAPPVANQASDATLRRAIQLHEVGEQADLLGAPAQDAKALRSRPQISQPAPHSSHAGVTPLVNERIALQGDPYAFADMQAARSVNAGDALAAKRYTQMGGTYDRPIPQQGRQHRALERSVARDFDLLPRAERLPVLVRSAVDGASHNQEPSIQRRMDQWSRSLNESIRQATGAVPPASDMGRFDAVRQRLSEIPDGLRTAWRYLR